jgi:hypothetical protein
LNSQTHKIDRAQAGPQMITRRRGADLDLERVHDAPRDEMP